MAVRGDATVKAAARGVRRATAFGSLLRGESWEVQRAYQMLAIMIPLAILSQFYRASNGVIGPNLMADLRITEAELGNISAAFFIIFAVMQLPVGLLLDRYSNRVVLSSMLIPAIAGSLLCALADSYSVMILGRLFLGFGCAGLMVGSLVMLSRWLPPEKYTFAMSLLFAWANAGHLMAGAPLGAATDIWGWRSSFVVVTLLTAVFGLLFYAVARDAPPDHAFHKREPESLADTARGFIKVWQLPQVLFILPMIMIGYASVKAVLGLWGGPYLHEVYGLGELERGNILSMMSLAMIAGTLAYGPLDRIFNTRKGVVIAGALATVAILMVMTMWPAPALWVAILLLCAFAFIGAYSLVVMAHGLAVIPKELAGRGITTLNVGLMGGAALIQAGTGPLIEQLSDLGASTDLPYRGLFLTLALVTLAALLFYLKTRDAKPVRT